MTLAANQQSVHATWSASCPDTSPPGSAPGNYWSVQVRLFEDDGSSAGYNSVAYGPGPPTTAPPGTSALDLPLTIRRGADGKQVPTETFTWNVTLGCHNQDSVIGSGSFTVKQTKPCDPNLFAKAQREFDTAKSFYAAGVMELNTAADNIRQFRNDYIKESAEIGAEKLTALDILRTLSEHLFEAAEVTGLYVGIGVTIEELAFKIIPLARDSSRLSTEAHNDFQRGEMWAARGMADLQQALAGGPCLGPIEAREKKLLDEQRLADQARAKIDTWQNNGYNYLSPITGEVVSEAAALKQARAALLNPAATPPATQRAKLAARRKIKATAVQVRAALAYIQAAQAIHRRAADQAARLYSASRLAGRQLKRLLKAWPR